MDGASPNLFGSVISIRVWLRLSLMRLSSGIRPQDDEVAMAAHLRDYADFLEVAAKGILPCRERLETGFHKLALVEAAVERTRGF
jgi:hypothetical protein